MRTILATSPSPPRSGSHATTYHRAMQSVELILLVAIGLAIAGGIAARVAAYSSAGGVSTATKVAIGALIGLIGAITVAVLSADFVPDAWEQTGRPILVGVITLALIAAFARRWVPR